MFHAETLAYPTYGRTFNVPFRLLESSYFFKRLQAVSAPVGSIARSFLDVLDFAIEVDHKGGAIGYATWHRNPVGYGCFSLEITKEGK